MTNIASTAAFFPHNKNTLRQQLVEWNLADEIDFREEEEGQIVVFAKDSTLWPQEWTPEQDEIFEAFEIADFLHMVAQPGQTIRTFDSQGARGVYISRGVAATA